MQPVVVYGASGYTGRLTCQALGRLGLPFVVAGRNQARLDALVAELEVDGADCVARAVDHTPAALRDLVRGARVVVNISGPFSLLGHAVVQAALDEGCHYVDSTGEQDFMLELRRDFGRRFERAGLVLAPSTAFLWGAGTAAAELVLETPGVWDLEAVYCPPPLQTMASLQSMLRSARRASFDLFDHGLREIPTARVRRAEIRGLPGQRTGVVVGGGEATFFLDDERVRACETIFATDELVRATPIMRTWALLGHWLPGDLLDGWSDSLVELLKRNPPAEDPEAGRFVLRVEGTGPNGRIRAVVTGTSPYALTGFLAANAADMLLTDEPRRTGYASLAQAFGASAVFGRLAEVGVEVSLEGMPARAASRAAADREVQA